MNKFGAFLKRQDAFGEPVTINYKGDASYNTIFGGTLTLFENFFIIVVAILGLIELMAYKDPNVTQFKIYDARENGKEFNFGEHHGNFLFALY